MESGRNYDNFACVFGERMPNNCGTLCRRIAYRSAVVGVDHEPLGRISPQNRSTIDLASAARPWAAPRRSCTRSGDSPLRSGSGCSSTSCEFRYLELPCDFFVFFLRERLAKGSIRSTNAVVDMVAAKSRFGHYYTNISPPGHVKPRHQHPSNASYAPVSVETIDDKV